MSDKEAYQIQLLEEVLSRYETQLATLTDAWHKCETKAQSTIAISGVLTSITGLLIRQNGNDIPEQMNIVLALAIIFLTFSIIFSIQVLQGKKITSPPTGKVYKGMCMDIIKSKEEITHETKVNVVFDRISLWEYTIENKVEAYERKYQFARIANYSLLIGLVLISIIFIVEIN